MKKSNKLPKYQFGNNPCGPGTVWDPGQGMCVPVANSQVDPIFNNYLWANPKDLKGSPQPPVNPYANQAQTEEDWLAEWWGNRNSLGAPKPAGAESLQGGVDTQGYGTRERALAQGFNEDSDGQFRKLEITEDPNHLWYNKGFQQLNVGLDAVRGIANIFNTARASRKEREKYLEAIQPDARINPYERGLNNVPVYMAEGGDVDLVKTKKNSIAKGKVTNEARRDLMTRQVQNPYGIYTHQIDTNYIDKDAPTELESMLINLEYMKNNWWDGGVNMPYRPKNMHITENGTAVKKGLIPLAQDGGSFGNAFKSARKKGDKTFVWKGKKYTTELAEDNLENAPQVSNRSTRVALEKKAAVEAAANAAKAKQKAAKNSAAMKNFAESIRPNMSIPVASTPLTPAPIAPKPVAKKATNNPKLESGVIVDKRSNEAYVIQNGKVARNFPVLTGKNPERNDNLYSMNELDNNPSLRSTPIGGYQMAMSQYLIYGDKGYHLNPLAFPGYGVPAARDLAIHNTYDPANRNKYYTQPGPNRAQSYGCINCKKSDLDKLKQEFPKGDTLLVIDPKKGQTLQSLGIQRQEGGPVNMAAELEKGEVFLDNSGNILKVPESHATHENGGSVQYNVDRVLEDTSDKRKDKVSKSLLIHPDEAEQMLGFKPKGKKSHSKLFEIAAKRGAKKVKEIEKQIEKNLDYIKFKNGDKFSEAALNENIKRLNQMPQEEDIFNVLYDHQEAVKYMHDYDAIEEMMCGGKNKKMRKYAPGGSTDIYFDVDPYKGGKTTKGRKTPTGKDNAFSFEGGIAKYKELWKQAGVDLSSYKTNAAAQSAVYDHLLKTNPDVIRQMWSAYGNTNAGIAAGLPATFDDTYLANIDNLRGLKKGYVDNYLGIRTLVPAPSINITTPATVPDLPQTNTATQPAPDPNMPQFKKPNPVTPSTTSSPLGYAAGLGNILGYIDALDRIPVDLEQLDRDPLRVHELNPLPTLMANQGDFNALVNQLPNSGVGYANMANLSANKYAANNQVLGQYENTNKQRYDAVDQFNNQAEWQKDVTNLQLRDTFNNRVLTSKEKQRLQKSEFLNGVLKAIDDRNAFDRNANLMLQMTPYFDEYGRFNGNQYQMANRYVVPGGNTVEITPPDATGQRFRIIRDKDGKLISNTKVVANNRAVDTPIK